MRSYSFRSSCVFLTLGLAAFSAGVVFVGALFFGAGEGLTVLGLLSCFLSSGLSRIGVDAGLLRGPYSAPNLLGSGTVMAKIMPTARLGGAAGYLQKVSGMERLLATVREFAAGELRVLPRWCGGFSRVFDAARRWVTSLAWAVSCGGSVRSWRCSRGACPTPG